MSRTNIPTRVVQYPWNPANAAALKAKSDEHDTALDALEAFTGGTIDFKQSCRVATTANHALSGLSAINGVTPVAGNRILVRAQDAGAENGIYVAASGAWARASDANASAEMTAGLLVFVSEGTADPNSWYQLTTADPITLGSTALTFTKAPTLAELASTATGKGASLIALEDASPGYFTTDNVEAALREIWTKLIKTTTPGGASYIGLFDTTDHYTAADVEAALKEIMDRIKAADSTSLSLVQKCRDAGSLYTAETLDGQLQEVKALADAAIALQKRELRIQHSDLTDAVNGEAQAINLGDALPANAVVIGAEVNIATLFSGGSASAVKLDIGGTDADAIAAQMDVFTGAATGALTPTPAGVHSRGKFSSQQLKATFTPDGSHTLDGLDAGDLTITVWFSVLA